MGTRYEVCISGLRVTRADGRRFVVPWNQTTWRDTWLASTEAARHAFPDLRGRLLMPAPHTTDVIRRLQTRATLRSLRAADWRTEVDGRGSRSLVAMSGVAAAALPLLLLFPLLRRPAPLHFGNGQAWPQPLFTISVVLLVTMLLILAGISVVFLYLMRWHLRGLLPRRRIVALQLDRVGLLARYATGEASRFEWCDFVRVYADGRLVVRGRRDILVVFPRERGQWSILSRAITAKFVRKTPPPNKPHNLTKLVIMLAIFWAAGLGVLLGLRRELGDNGWLEPTLRWTLGWAVLGGLAIVVRAIERQPRGKLARWLGRIPTP